MRVWDIVRLAILGRIRTSARGRIAPSALVLALAGGWAAASLAQSDHPVAFVANNGDLEGSVTTYVFEELAPHFSAKFVTGSRPNLQSYHPGTNAAAISLTPNGRFLAITHTTQSTTIERISILQVHGNGTVAAFATADTPDSPEAAVWISDSLLAVTATRTSAASEVLVYRLVVSPPGLVEMDRKQTGMYSAYLRVHPSGNYLYTQDMTGYTVSAFSVNTAGVLTPLGDVSTLPVQAMGLCMTPDGTKLYSMGGFSNGANKIIGCRIDPDTGALTSLGASPFGVPGTAPALAIASPPGTRLVVGYAGEPVIRVFNLNQQTGQMSANGGNFDVGANGSIGGLGFLGDSLLLTNNAVVGDSGLYSFTFSSIGALVQHGDIVASQGARPTNIATWVPPPDSCNPCDANCDGSINQFDIQPFVNALLAGATCSTCAADSNSDGTINQFDIQGFVDCLAS